jgi:hypothetical protein
MWGPHTWEAWGPRPAERDLDWFSDIYVCPHTKCSRCPSSIPFSLLLQEVGHN